MSDDEHSWEEEHDEEFEGDDVEDEDEESLESDEEREDDDFETKAAKFMRRMKATEQLAAEEFDDQRRQTERTTALADAEAEAEGISMQLPHHSAEELRGRIAETIRVLSDFKSMREDGRDRDEYLELFRADTKELFEYNDFLLDRIIEMFPPQEAMEFLEGMERERPMTIRVNTIKTKRRELIQNLTRRGVNVEPLEKWSKFGLQVFESNVAVGATPEYLAGHYMLQSAVSFLPVMALDPQENERVLDMAAAPGGKTTFICSLMRNTGVVFANDISEPRIKSLNANIQRLGVINCIVTNYSAIGYDKIMKNFDRVLLDAPCTGTGIIARDKSIKSSKTHEDTQRATDLQRRLLLSAIDCVNANSATGGFVVYSTCSFLVEENEAVVDYALRKRHVEIVEMGLPFGRPGFTKYRHQRFDPSVANARRYFPHVHNMDGFFVCKLRKLRDGPKVEEKAPSRPASAKEIAARKRQREADAVPVEMEAKVHSARVSIPPKPKRVVKSSSPAGKGGKPTGKPNRGRVGKKVSASSSRAAGSKRGAKKP